MEGIGRFNNHFQCQGFINQRIINWEVGKSFGVVLNLVLSYARVESYAGNL